MYHVSRAYVCRDKWYSIINKTRAYERSHMQSVHIDLYTRIAIQRERRHMYTRHTDGEYRERSTRTTERSVDRLTQHGGVQGARILRVARTSDPALRAPVIKPSSRYQSTCIYVFGQRVKSQLYVHAHSPCVFRDTTLYSYASTLEAARMLFMDTYAGKNTYCHSFNAHECLQFLAVSRV